MRWIYTLFALPVILATVGCPAPQEDAKPAKDVAADTTQDASINPASPIPTDNPYQTYAGLYLGMGTVELSQIYNAPKGLGDGFTRVIEHFGDVQNHIIEFEQAEGEPARKIVASLYRDELFILVDRQDWVTSEQRDAWWDEMLADYGEDYETVLPTSQWSWGDREGVLLTFTQDNATEELMTANVVLKHIPTREAAHNYSVIWHEENPDDE